jgi:hypothetical protein
MPLCVPSHRMQRQAETNNSPLALGLRVIGIGRTPIRRRSTYQWPTIQKKSRCLYRQSASEVRTSFAEVSRWKDSANFHFPMFLRKLLITASL